MDAASNKTRTFASILFVFIFGLWIKASADAPDGSRYDRTVLEISLKRFKQAERELEEAIVQCDKARKTVPASVFQPLGMDIEDIKVVLYVLNRRAEDACENGARERLLFAASAHSAVAEHYGADAGDASQYTGDLLFAMHWSRLEFEAKYLALDPELRKRLESIEELKVPFRLFDTLDGIERSL